MQVHLPPPWIFLIVFIILYISEQKASQASTKPGTVKTPHSGTPGNDGAVYENVIPTLETTILLDPMIIDDDDLDKIKVDYSTRGSKPGKVERGQEDGTDGRSGEGKGEDGADNIVNTNKQNHSTVDKTSAYNGMSDASDPDSPRSRVRKEVEHRLLSLFGMDRTPRPSPRSKTDSASRYMRRLYDVQSAGRSAVLPTKLSNADADVVRYLEESDVVVSLAYEDEGSDSWSYDLSDLDAPRDQLTKSIIRVHVPASATHPPPPSSSATAQGEPMMASTLSHRQTADYQIRVYEQKSDRLELIGKRSVRQSEGKWYNIDITSSMHNWLRKKTKYPTIIARIIQQASNTTYLLKLSADHRPFIMCFFKSASTENFTKARFKRSTNQRKTNIYHETAQNWKPSSIGTNNKSNRKCQKRTLNVSFAELGWQDWTIAPDSYMAHYCEGECSFPIHAHMNASNHAIVQNLAHLMNPSRVPSPCCAPFKLQPLSMLYLDDHSNVVLKKYRNMVVKSCGCH